ncbi:MAG: hypothetical protein IOB09_02290 [Burkholderia sp.]|nr:hypothetical protein [Burkholderia sp.]
MEVKAPESESARTIRQEIASFLRSKSNLPVTAEHATEKLLAKSLDLDEIKRRREAFSTHAEIDGTAVLANYELLHGVKYLDRLINCEKQQIDTKCIVAILRGTEICLNNISVLADRIIDDVSHSRFGDVSIKITWMNHFNDSLHRFAQLLVQTDLGRNGGDFLSIEDSATYQAAAKKTEAMYEALKTAPESVLDLSEKDLDDPQRFTFFHTFVNTNYETIWLAVLRHVRVPGVFRHEGESAEAFYQRVVQNDEVRDAVNCVDLKDPTYLMQFRAYHQISEVLVGLVNDVIADSILALVDEANESFGDEATSLAMCNKLLQIVTDNIKPIVRTLSPKAYFAIRPALGITSGWHSHNLRKGLVLTIYPLLVRALRLRLVQFNETAARDDDAVLEQAQQVLRQNTQPELAAMIRQTVYVYQYVRTWRDEHIQFVKTQIGVSPEDNTPTASISGAENAAQTAHNFRSTHLNDPIGPLYEATLGKRPPAPFSIVHPGGFDEHMAFFTANAVKAMYADVQQRAQRKRDRAVRVGGAS